MAGERAQERTARAIASLGTDPLQLDIDLLLRGGGGGSGSPSLSSSTSSSPRLAPSSRNDVTSRPPGAAALPSVGGGGAAVGAAAPTATDAPGPTVPLPQGGRPTARLRGAQAEAGRKALALNLELQAALRKELQGLDKTLKRNREVLKAAEARLSSKRCVGITTSSNKLRWSRGVGRFLQVEGHPGGNLGLHKEEEAHLRRDPVPWKPAEVKALWDYVAANHPDALNPEKATKALPAIDWKKVAAFVDEDSSRHVKRDRSRFVRTWEDCRVRWTHVEVLGGSPDSSWTKEEDLAIMVQAEQRGGREWVKIAEEVQKVNGGTKRRTAIACLRRFQTTLNTNLVRWDKWTPEEDEALLAAIKRYGPSSWLLTAGDIPGRTSGQCFSRYQNLTRRREGWRQRQPQGRRQQEKHEHLRGKQEGQRVQQEQQQQQQQAGEKGSNPEDEEDSPQGTARLGNWTLAEQRRLCLIVRALMPQEQEQENQRSSAAGADPGTGAAASAAANPPRGVVGKGKKRRRNGEAPALELDKPRVGGAAAGGTSSSSRDRREAANTLDYLNRVNWAEVASLMSTKRDQYQCREKWFKVLDPSINRQRNWEADEDKQLLNVVEARKIGEWRAVERDMADWALKRGRLRRTDASCRKRYAALEPEKFEQHLQILRDRREVEPRMNAKFRKLTKTEITLEDFDLVDSEEEENGGGGRGSGDHDGEDDQVW